METIKFKPAPPMIDMFNIIAEKTCPLVPPKPKSEEPEFLHAHGLNGFDCCLYCEEEIDQDNPGKLVIMGRIKEHVCISCYLDKGYQEIIKETGAIVKNYTL